MEGTRTRLEAARESVGCPDKHTGNKRNKLHGLLSRVVPVAFLKIPEVAGLDVDTRHFQKIGLTSVDISPELYLRLPLSRP